GWMILVKPLIEDFEPEMVMIPEGHFLMGCDRGADNEQPVHRVWVDRFAMARTAITNRLYCLFIEDSGHPAPTAFSDGLFNHPDQPVTSVNWFDATAYCAWLAERTGRPYRLPTEAEWERAARGGLERALYTWGDEPPQSRPHYFSAWANGPARVAERPPNEFGLCDISENVHEWCADWYDPHYYSRSPERNPQGPPAGARKASRGGSWRHQIKITRVAAR